MNQETPLDEVVQHLPAELVEYLVARPKRMQAEVISYLRTGITAMEDNGAVLDPASYHAVVYAMGLLAILAADSNSSSNGEGHRT